MARSESLSRLRSMAESCDRETTFVGGLPLREQLQLRAQPQAEQEAVGLHDGGAGVRRP